MTDPGRLRELVGQRSEEALACGALVPIATELEVVEERGIPFVVHILSGIRSKTELTRSQRQSGFNPFLPADPRLLVAELGRGHRCVLNKFNVLGRHLLIVTRDFAPQQALLDETDFAALAATMAAVDGLGFYNAGTVAGASQPHKHLQLVPTPLGGGALPTPIDTVLDELADGGPRRCAGLGFEHALIGLPGRSFTAADGESLHLGYRRLLAAVGVRGDRHPYNLLVSPRWMLLVPRRAECFDGVSVNALGFAGSLLVPDRARLDRVRELGPTAVLRSVAGVAAAGG